MGCALEELLKIGPAQPQDESHNVLRIDQCAHHKDRQAERQQGVVEQGHQHDGNAGTQPDHQPGFLIPGFGSGTAHIPWQVKECLDLFTKRLVFNFVIQDAHHRPEQRTGDEQLCGERQEGFHQGVAAPAEALVDEDHDDGVQQPDDSALDECRHQDFWQVPEGGLDIVTEELQQCLGCFSASRDGLHRRGGCSRLDSGNRCRGCGCNRLDRCNWCRRNRGGCGRRGIGNPGCPIPAQPAVGVGIRLPPDPAGILQSQVGNHRVELLGGQLPGSQPAPQFVCLCFQLLKVHTASSADW